MSYTYEREAIAELADDLVAAGWRVFIAESGGHGFYTDQEGTKVISFQCSLGIISAGLNYRRGSRTAGTGCQITTDFNAGMAGEVFSATPWSRSGYSAEENGGMATLEDHLSKYDPSSHYTEVSGVAS